ncbi:MAG: OsmC family protein [Fimbriimonadales bacterium]|nr:OsmC family protein [Fimbriimonadales bacterium]
MSEYTFHAEAHWRGDSNAVGSLQIPAGLSCPIAIPELFKGPGGAPNPEELLLGALCACYAMTLAYLVETKKLPLEAHSIRAQGHLHREPESRRLRFTRINLYVELVPAPDASPEDLSRLTALAKEAKDFCLISNALHPDIDLAIHPSLQQASSGERH